MISRLILSTFLAAFVFLSGAALEPASAQKSFRDCSECPEIVVIPAGSFLMGVAEGDLVKAQPQHTVEFSTAFGMGRTEVTVRQYKTFISATGYEVKNTCWTYESQKFRNREERDWTRPGIDQADDEPVVCVDGEDAQTYVEWLAELTGEAYRLPSESEWEYVTRVNQQASDYWNDDLEMACLHANLADNDMVKVFPNGGTDNAHFDCEDGTAATAPVASRQANAFGVYDMLGNVWEIVADCWFENYEGAPADGSAWLEEGCKNRVVRGGSWFSGPGRINAEERSWNSPTYQNSRLGFRVAKTLE